MRLDVQIDPTKLIAKTTKAQKNLAYSTVQAINDTAKDVQLEIQGRVKQLFHIRKNAGGGSSSEFSDATGDQPSRGERSFIVRQIKIMAFANVKKGLLFAEVGIAKKPRLLLSLYEKGGKREPFVGKHVAVPTIEGARDGSLDNPVDGDLTFRKLGFKKVPTKGRKQALKAAKKAGMSKDDVRALDSAMGSDGYQIKGRERTFILKQTKTHPMGGVFQRTGPKDEDIRLIYSFQRAFRLRAVLHFVQTSKDVYSKRFRENFLARFYRLQK